MKKAALLSTEGKNDIRHSKKPKDLVPAAFAPLLRGGGLGGLSLHRSCAHCHNLCDVYAQLSCCVEDSPPLSLALIVFLPILS